MRYLTAAQRVFASSVSLLAALGQAWPHLEATARAVLPPEVASVAFLLPQALQALCIGPVTALRTALQKPANGDAMARHKALLAQAAVALLPQLLPSESADASEAERALTAVVARNFEVRVSTSVLLP